MGQIRFKYEENSNQYDNLNDVKDPNTRDRLREFAASINRRMDKIICTKS